MLDKCVEKYDGALGFVINYSVQLLNFAIEQKNLENLQKYNLLLENKNEMLLKVPEELLIETNLLIFSILIDKILKNQSQSQSFL